MTSRRDSDQGEGPTAESLRSAQGLALGMVSTILGAIKDRLACEYVSRSAGKPTHTLRLDELFRGTAAGQV